MLSLGGEGGVVYFAAMLSSFSANRGLPLPLGRRVCETKSKKTGTQDKNRVYGAQRGIETMVSHHGLRRGHAMA